MDVSPWSSRSACELGLQTKLLRRAHDESPLRVQICRTHSPGTRHHHVRVVSGPAQEGYAVGGDHGRSIDGVYHSSHVNAATPGDVLVDGGLSWQGLDDLVRGWLGFLPLSGWRFTFVARVRP
jgi:hypothetical protein